MPRRPHLLLLLLLLGQATALRADLNLAGGNILNQTGADLGVNFNADADSVDDLVFSPSGRLGLLTASPSANLHVAGNMLIEHSLLLGPLSAAPAVEAGLTAVFVLSGNLAYRDANGTVALTGVPPWSTATGNLVCSAARVGVGTAAPSANLHVSGNAAISGPLLLGNGSVAAPALSFAGDPDSGLFLGAAGNLCLGQDGGARISVTSGNINLHGLDLKTDGYSQTDCNTWLGVRAGQGVTHTTGDTGWYNTGVGVEALKAVTSGYYNTALGYQAMQAVTSGNNNTAIYSMNWASVSGASRENTIVGYNTQNLSTGYRLVGCSQPITSHGNITVCGGLAPGQDNTAMGSGTLSTWTCGSYLAAVGRNALGSPADSDSTAIGDSALATASKGGRSLALGAQAGYSTTTGGNNVLAGLNSGYAVTTGCNLVLLGANAGGTLTTASNTICLGAGRTPSLATSGHWLEIGGALAANLISGRVGIGTTVPAGNLQVSGNVVSGNILPLASGVYNLGSASVAWSAVHGRELYLLSDRRLKADIRPLAGGEEALLALEPVRFRWRAGGGERLGFLAQDLERALPGAVSAGPGPERQRLVDQEQLVPLLARAIRVQADHEAGAMAACLRELQALRERHAALRRTVEALREER